MNTFRVKMAMVVLTSLFLGWVASQDGVQAAKPAYPSVPGVILKKYELAKKQKSRSARVKTFGEASSALSEIIKEMRDDPDNKKGYDSLAVFQLEEMFLQVNRQGFKPEGCKKSLRLMPFWADPTLSDIQEAHEPARFTYDFVKVVCK